MNYENINIRKAKNNDIEEIAIIKVDGWKAAYDGLIDSEILDTMDINKEIDSYTNHYSLDNVFVAESNVTLLRSSFKAGRTPRLSPTALVATTPEPPKPFGALPPTASRICTEVSLPKA